MPGSSVPAKAIYVGLGSNLGSGADQIAAALACLGRHDAIRVKRVSSLYRTSPWGVIEQPDFTNAVAEVRTELGPRELLQALLDCETALGRTRDGRRWGPRRIDLDLLTYGQLCLQTPMLQLPHPRMHERAFVLVPLLELEPDFAIPGVGRARDCLERIGDESVARLRCADEP